MAFAVPLPCPRTAILDAAGIGNGRYPVQFPYGAKLPLESFNIKSGKKTTSLGGASPRGKIILVGCLVPPRRTLAIKQSKHALICPSCRGSQLNIRTFGTACGRYGRTLDRRRGNTYRIHTIAAEALREGCDFYRSCIGRGIDVCLTPCRNSSPCRDCHRQEHTKTRI